MGAGAAKDLRPLGNVRILLVEDDDDIRDCVADVLALHGAAITTAASGTEGLQAFRRERPDLVISDLWMPGEDGLAMIRSIRGYEPDQGGLTPAVALSAAGYEKTAMMSGYHAFIAKPFDISRLLSIVEDFTREDGASRLAAPWTIHQTCPGLVVVRLYADVRAADMRNLMHALFHHLDEGPVDVLVDLRQLVSFAPSIGSVGERALWSRRGQIRSLHTIGGSLLARLVSASACRILAIPYFEDSDAEAAP